MAILDKMNSGYNLIKNKKMLSNDVKEDKLSESLSIPESLIFAQLFSFKYLFGLKLYPVKFTLKFFKEEEGSDFKQSLILQSAASVNSLHLEIYQ